MGHLERALEASALTYIMDVMYAELQAGDLEPSRSRSIERCREEAAPLHDDSDLRALASCPELRELVP